MHEESVSAQLARIIQILEKQDHTIHPDPVAQAILSLVPIVGILAGAVVLGFFIRHYFETRRMMIEAGRFPAPTVRHLRSLTLLGGILSIAAGLPLTLLFLAVEGLSYPLLGGLIPLCAGIGLLIFFAMARESESSESNRP